MTTRAEDLKSALTNPNLGGKRRAYVEAELAKETGEKSVKREAEPETATRAAAPEKAVSRTTKKG